MKKRPVISIGKEQKELKIDKNGYLMIRLKELSGIVDGTLVNMDLPFEEWESLKRWVDFHYDKLLFFKEFPEEMEYNPLKSKNMRKERDEEEIRKRWWQVWSK